jgi:hypothetical protein
VWGYPAFDACSAEGGSAVSSLAVEVLRATCALAESAERSEFLFGEKAAALSQLWALASQCGEANWDGAGAVAIDAGAIQNAEEFVRALPNGFPIPDFAPEPDGAVSLDWIQSRNRMFSLSIGSGSRFAYAWLEGSDRGHGVVRFDKRRLPARLIEEICRITNHGDSTVWSC